MKKFFGSLGSFFSNLAYMLKLMFIISPAFFILAALSSLISGVGGVLQPYLLGKIIDGLLGEAEFVKIIICAVLVIAFLYLAKLNQRMLFSMNRVVTEKLGIHMEEQILDAMDNVRISQMDSPEFQNRVEQAKNLTKRTPHSIFMNLLGMITLAATAIGFIILLAQLNILYLLILIASCILVGIVNRKYEENVMFCLFANTPERRKSSYFSSLLTQRENLEEIHQYNAMAFFKRLFKFNADTQIERSWKIFRKNGFLYSLAAVVSYAGCGVVYVLILREAFLGRISVGDVAMYLSATIGIQGLLLQLIDGVTQLPEDCAVMRNYRSLLDELRASKKESPKDLPDTVSTEGAAVAAFNNVSFAYPGSENKVFDSQSFTIARGEHVAVVGINGAGKTTLVRLLCGMYDEYEGDILLNGHDLRTMSNEDRSKSVAVMFQSYLKPSIQLGEAVSLCGADEQNHERLERVLRECDYCPEEGTAVELTRMFAPNGLIPSGGQWQRIALARMLYRDSDICVLDEPSAALDPQAEDKVFKLIADLERNKTVIFVTHRLASVRSVDKILFIDSTGKIHSSDHNTLMATNPEYNALYTAQAEKYVDQDNEQS